VAHPSDSTGSLGAGDYAFQAEYQGDDNYNKSTSGCEPFSVAKDDTTTTTEIHLDDETVVANGSSVDLGSSLHDSATVTDGGKGTPTGDVTFTFFTGGDCDTGTPFAAGTVALDASGVAHPSDSTGSLGAGDYAFQAEYQGDDNYNKSTSGCEPFSVAKAQLTVDTKVHDANHNDITNTEVAFGSVVHDTAKINGSVSGFTTPDVTFAFYANGTCDGAGTAVANTGADEADLTAVRSAASAALGAGSYSYKGSVAGNDNYIGDDSDCEPFTVKAEVKSQITPTATTCAMFRDGTSATLFALDYSVKNGKINQVAPGVFFYWIEVTATVTGQNTFVIDQNNDQATFNHFFNVASGSNVFSTDCTRVAGNAITQGTGLDVDKTTITFNGTIGTNYIIGVKYDSGSVKGFDTPNPTTVNYTFETLGISGSTEGIALQQK